MKKTITSIQRRAFEGFFQTMAFAENFSKHQKKTRALCELIPDVPYTATGLSDHCLDIMRPRQRKGPLPVLLYIHGGGFTICSKQTHRSIAMAYARHGKMLVFNINYRLAPKHRFPAAFEDVSQAFSWVAKNAEKYGGDLDRFFVAGESAGGNLTLSTAIAASFQRPEPAARRIWETNIMPKAVMPLCGVYQVSAPARFVTGEKTLKKSWLRVQENMMVDVSKAYLGRGWHTPDPEKALADPLLILESDQEPDRPFPRVFSMVGTGDILRDDTLRLEKALADKNIENEVKYYAKQGHAFHLFAPWGKHGRQFWRDHFTFLHRHL